MKGKKSGLQRWMAAFMAMGLLTGTCSGMNVSEVNAADMVTAADTTTDTTAADIRDWTITPGADTTEARVAFYLPDTQKGELEVQVSKASSADTVWQKQTVTEKDTAGGYISCKAEVTGMTPGETYVFLVGDKDNGAQYTYTAPAAGDFTFAAVGDPQLYDTNLDTNVAAWTDSVKKMAEKGVSFIAGTGDQVNDGNSETEYVGFFDGMNAAGRQIPFAPVVGNHDSGSREIYGYHYNIPNAQSSANGIVNYYYLYNNVLFVVLDTGNYPVKGTGAATEADIEAAKPYIAEYRAVIEAAKTANAGKYDWLVVQHHKSTQSNADHWDDKDINAYIGAGFQDLMTSENVDVVLAGHDHEYSRTYPLASVNNQVTPDKANGNDGNALTNPQGTVYMTLNSASGSKFYDTHTPIKETAKVSMQNKKPMFTTVNVTKNTLTFDTYETDHVGNAVDSFTLTKTVVPELPKVSDLTLTPGRNASELNVNWYSDSKSAGTPTVKAAPANDAENVKTYTGVQKAATEGYNHNKVSVTGLQADTEYVFQVSADGGKTEYSETYRFKTAGNAEFTFAAVGDPQLYEKNLDTNVAAWSETVKQMAAKGVSFVAGTGDQVNDGTSEMEYTGFFTGMNAADRLIPFAPVVGNHDSKSRDIFGYHYNMPNAQASEKGIINYYYLYNNVLFVVLDTGAYPADGEGEPTAEEIAEAKAYVNEYDAVLKAATEANKGNYNWLVVQHHKSTQSNADHWNDKDINAYIEAGLQNLMTKYSVDVVLAGHDHEFSRTYPLASADGKVTLDKANGNDGDNLTNPNGTVYMTLNSASGSKFYDTHTPIKETAKVSMQNKKPMFTTVNVTENTLTVSTYEAQESNPADRFVIVKEQAGNNKPSTDKPSTDKPSTDKPSTDKPSTNKPSANKPSTDKTSVNKSSVRPKTGDNNAVFVTAAILMMSAAVMAVVFVKRKRMGQNK